MVVDPEQKYEHSFTCADPEGVGGLRVSRECGLPSTLLVDFMAKRQFLQLFCRRTCACIVGPAWFSRRRRAMAAKGDVRNP